MIETLAISGYRSLRNIVSYGTVESGHGRQRTGNQAFIARCGCLADAALNTVVASLAREGGLPSTLWAGPETIARSVRQGEHPVQGTPRQKAVSLKLGFAGDPFSYCIDLGYPPPAQTAFPLDPAIKRECIWHGGVYRRAAVLVDRANRLVQIAPAKTAKHEEPAYLDQGTQLYRQHARQHRRSATRSGDAGGARVRSRLALLRGFPHGPGRPGAHSAGRHIHARSERRRCRPCRGARNDPPLRRRAALDRTVDDAFPGSRLGVEVHGGRFEVQLGQHGLLRPLGVAELSDGTLRFLLWTAALLTPRPPELMVLNEPETSLHPDLLPALARLIALLLRARRSSWSRTPRR